MSVDFSLRSESLSKSRLLVWHNWQPGESIELDAKIYTDPSRCVAGLGVGALSAIVPLYIGEAAPKKLRGTLLVLYQVQIATGIFIAYIINLGTHNIENSSAAWRVPIGLQLAWGLFLIFGAMLLPESPRLLLGKGQTDKAIVAIARLNDASVEDPVTREVMEEMSEAIREENEGGKAGWLECFGYRNGSESAAWCQRIVTEDSVEKDYERNDGSNTPAAQRAEFLLLREYK